MFFAGNLSIFRCRVEAGMSQMLLKHYLEATIIFALLSFTFDLFDERHRLEYDFIRVKSLRTSGFGVAISPKKRTCPCLSSGKLTTG